MVSCYKNGQKTTMTLEQFDQKESFVNFSKKLEKFLRKVLVKTAVFLKKMFYAKTNRKAVFQKLLAKTY